MWGNLQWGKGEESMIRDVKSRDESGQMGLES